jgi:hypothetical protein
MSQVIMKNRLVWVVARSLSTDKLVPALFKLNDPYIVGLQVFDNYDSCLAMCVE